MQEAPIQDPETPTPEFFQPSEKLAGKIGEAQLQFATPKENLIIKLAREHAGFALAIADRILGTEMSMVKTTRLDTTPTEAPESPDEPLSIERTQTSIQVRFQRFVGTLAHETQRAGRGRLRLADINGFRTNVIKSLAYAFGFPGEANYNEWSPDLLRELRQWLKSLPNHQKQYEFGILKLTPEDHIELTPKTNK